jgi:hypothetical protein
MSWSARIATLIVSVATLAGAAPAIAGTNIHFDAKIRVISGGDRMQYHGRVRSNVEACEVGRTVRITNARRLIGQTATDERGKFSLKADAVPEGSSVKFKLKPNGPECPAQTLFVEI